MSNTSRFRAFWRREARSSRSTFSLDEGNQSDQGEGRGSQTNKGSQTHRGNRGNKALFLRLLKARYKQLYDAVQPIPYIRDRMYCVDRVFVEGGIEYLAGSWVLLNSYHGVFKNPQIRCRRRILVGEPGYGKSTLTLQYVYDWCNRVDGSYLKDVEIVILLRLRQLGGVRSMYKAIWQFLLQRHPQFSEGDIESIVESSDSVVVILDGFDEYPDEHRRPLSDIMKMIMTPVFHNFEVILTTRYLPKQFAPETKRLRLTGFNDKARNEYIRKAVAGNDAGAISQIKQELDENPVLEDLCEVPLFFAMFAHMSHENKESRTFQTVTDFFQYMIQCFHSHMRNKMDDANVQRYHMYEEDHRKLDKIAFAGLSKENQQIVWSRKDLRYELGGDFYDQYIRTGILVEEEVIDDTVGYGSASSTDQRQVSFYHKLFCEWYAAHYLANSATILKTSDKLKELVRYMDPKDLQYCFRFACGLNRNAAPYLINCIDKSNKDKNKIAALCVLERGGQVDDILDTVRDVCSQQLRISETDSRGVQRCLVLFLETAAKYKISISSVYLSNCYSTVNLSGGNHLQLKSNLSIPVLTTLNKLTINTYGEGREITAEEFAGILQYSSKCLALKELVFGYCLLPQSVQAESVSVLRSRNVEVYWDPNPLVLGNQYQLNLDSGLWQHFYEDLDGSYHVEGVMTDHDYQSERVQYRDGSWHVVGDMTDDDYQSEVRQFRKERDERERRSLTRRKNLHTLKTLR